MVESFYIIEINLLSPVAECLKGTSYLLLTQNASRSHGLCENKSYTVVDSFSL